MRKYIFVLLCLFLYQLATAQPYGYAYVKTITIDATQVSGSTNLVNFPLLINTTHSDFRSVANGGQIASDDGYDIVFTSDDCNISLDFQLEQYDPTTGQIVAWVKVPVLDYSTDTEIQLYYGNASETSSASSTATWSSAYEAVLHLNQDPSVTAPQMSDGTGNGHSGTTQGSMLGTNRVSGLIGSAVSFDESDDCISLTDFDYANTKSFALSFWFNVSDNSGSSYQYLVSHGAWGTNHSLNTYFGEATLAIPADQNMLKTVFQDDNDATSTDGLNAGTTYADGNWHYYVFSVSDAGNPKVYIDGVEQANIGFNGGEDYNPTTNIFLGARSDLEGTRYYGGIMDEFRILNDQVSLDWILTEYRNQFSPSTFYTMSAEAAADTECAALLPVELIYFRAAPSGYGQVALHWSTAQEINNDYFLVERSSDGQNWESIQQVSGHGTTDAVQNYRAWDNAPLTGRAFYRLRQVDFDGHFDFSPIEAVEMKALDRIHLYPNPASTQLSLSFVAPAAQEGTMQISDNLGRVLLQQTVVLEEGVNRLEMALPIWNDGYYCLQLTTTSGQSWRRRFVVQK